MRGNKFRLSVLAITGALVLMVGAGVMCQKQKNVEGETPKADASTVMPATDSTMMGSTTMMADSSMHMKGATGTGMTADSMSRSAMTDYYTCSMHPQVHQAKPGKCPMCGMDLILKKIGKK